MEAQAAINQEGRLSKLVIFSGTRAPSCLLGGRQQCASCKELVPAPPLTARARGELGGGAREERMHGSLAHVAPAPRVGTAVLGVAGPGSKDKGEPSDGETKSIMFSFRLCSPTGSCGLRPLSLTGHQPRVFPRSKFPSSCVRAWEWWGK